MFRILMSFVSLSCESHNVIDRSQIQNQATNPADANTVVILFKYNSHKIPNSIKLTSHTSDRHNFSITNKWDNYITLKLQG